MEHVKRMMEKAQFLLDKDIKAFIKDHYDNYYFADILIVGETHLLISNFEGYRAGTNTRLLWIDIKDISEYNGGKE